MKLYKSIKFIGNFLLDSLDNIIYVESLNDPLFCVRYKLRVVKLVIGNFWEG